MIGFFPELYPDELVYSACSRYHQRMAYRSRESTAADLFGNPLAQVAIDFPSRLANLVHSYPFAQSQSVKQLINQNTQLPFYRPFVPTNRSAQIEDDMSGAGGGVIHGRLGVLTYNIRPQNLSFCPTCVEHDRAAFEETYWHRLHQLSGTDVCPDHKVFLEKTGFESRSGRLSRFFTTAEQAIELVPARSVDLTKHDHQIYLWLAQNARWLLDQPALSNDGGHQERYYELLFARELSGYAGSVKIKALCEQIKQHYSAELLQRFSCSVDQKHNWVRRFLHSMQRSQHPIEHLLMIQFLDTNAKDFFNLPPVRLPFGTGPWPCLNPMSQHFRELIINQYKLCYTKLTGKPKAVFTCQCGLVYSRVNPDHRLETRYSATGFEVVTPTWLHELKRLSAMSIPTEVLATRFCTNSKALQEVLTGRDFVYSVKTIRLEPLKNLSDNINSDQYLIQRDRRRRLWLKYLNSNPPPSRSLLCKKHQSLFYRILMDDKHWLQKHLPPRQRARGSGPRIDWTEKDQQLAKSVCEEAQRMNDDPGRPVRISLTCLARRVGKLAVISKRRHLLPLTQKALIQVSESVQEYAVRRVNWAAKSFRATGIVPTARQIQWRAAVSASIAMDPMVKDAIEENARQLINIATTANRRGS